MIFNFSLTKPEVEHILACLGDRDTGSNAGWYYGNKATFNLRHATLTSKLRQMLDSSTISVERSK